MIMSNQPGQRHPDHEKREVRTRQARRDPSRDGIGNTESSHRSWPISSPGSRNHFESTINPNLIRKRSRQTKKRRLNHIAYLRRKKHPIARIVTRPVELVPYYPDIPPTNWHGNDQFLRNFEYHELRDHVQAFAIPDAFEGDLDNPIHPLFSSLARHNGLHPALRLASAYLASPPLLPFWYALLFGDFRPIPELSSSFGAAVTTFRIQHENLTPVQIAKTQRMFVIASRLISIEFQTERIHAVAVWGHTLRDWEPVPSLNIDPSKTPGIASRMYLDPEFLTVLGRNNVYPTEHRVRASFMLAHTLLHELAHALRNMRVPCLPQNTQLDFEPFFHTQREAEMGRALETFFWGGRISSFLGRVDALYGLCFNKWPDLSEHMYVRRHGHPEGDPIPLAIRPEKKKWQTLYAVPHRWVQQQFKREFWVNEVRRYGGRALYVPRLLGLRTRNPEWWPPMETGIEAEDSSQERFEDAERMVRPGQRRRPPTPEIDDEDDEDI